MILRAQIVHSHECKTKPILDKFDLLHSMATSRDILFWTPRGQLLWNKRIIPVTNIAELVVYVLLPQNDDVTKPRTWNTFLDGLAELGVDKGIIKNKKVLSNLIERKRLPEMLTSQNESNVESSSAREEEEIASANGSEAEDTQESDNDTTVRKQLLL